ncbi:uncharacterized protein LOC144107147 [Amblyomma americanum]
MPRANLASHRSLSSPSASSPRGHAAPAPLELKPLATTTATGAKAKRSFSYEKGLRQSTPCRAQQSTVPPPTCEVFAFVANALLPALLALPPASTSSTAVYCSDDRIFAWPQPDVITSSCPAAPPPGYHFPGPSWKASSPATSATGYISSDRPPSPLCGLAGCASVHTTNPFVYIMQGRLQAASAVDVVNYDPKLTTISD